VLGDMICWWIGSVLCDRKITTTFAGETLEWSGPVHRGAFYSLISGAWLWMNLSEDSVRMAVIRWDMQMTLLSSTVERSCKPSQSFSRRLWVWYSIAVIGLSCLSIHKRVWWYHSQGREIKGPEGTIRLWTHITADCWSHIPLTYPGQGIDMECTAYKAFWTCKGTFDKTWSLKPRGIGFTP
jgi:hypothetical protein